MFLQLPGVREPLLAASAGVQLDPSVDLHVGLQLVGLPELLFTLGALVGLFSGVNQHVALEVVQTPELLATLLTSVKFDSAVQLLMPFQLWRQQKAFVADAADVWPIATVLPQVVQVQVPHVEGLPTGLTGELLVLGVALLVGL